MNNNPEIKFIELNQSLIIVIKSALDEAKNQPQFKSALLWDRLSIFKENILRNLNNLKVALLALGINRNNLINTSNLNFTKLKVLPWFNPRQNICVDLRLP